VDNDKLKKVSKAQLAAENDALHVAVEIYTADRRAMLDDIKSLDEQLAAKTHELYAVRAEAARLALTEKGLRSAIASLTSAVDEVNDVSR
jgi:hypothetical protein